MNLYGGKPSLGICQQCTENPDRDRSPKPIPITLGGVLHGAIGLAKAMAGIDRASDETIDRRGAICISCNQSESVAGVLQRCKICGCATAAKIRNASEKCPLGKW